MNGRFYFAEMMRFSGCLKGLLIALDGLVDFFYAGWAADVAVIARPWTGLHACFVGVAISVDADEWAIDGVGKMQQACIHADDALSALQQGSGLQ